MLVYLHLSFGSLMTFYCMGSKYTTLVQAFGLSVFIWLCCSAFDKIIIWCHLRWPPCSAQWYFGSSFPLFLYDITSLKVPLEVANRRLCSLERESMYVLVCKEFLFNILDQFAIIKYKVVYLCNRPNSTVICTDIFFCNISSEPCFWHIFLLHSNVCSFSKSIRFFSSLSCKCNIIICILYVIFLTVTLFLAQ